MTRQPSFNKLEIAGHTVSVTIVEGRAPSRPTASVDCGRDGARPSIIALHGFTGSSYDFQPLWETEVGSQFTWICPDFMGHGRSASPREPEPYSLANALKVIGKARALASDPDNVCLLAYSMGGRIALHYLMENPSLPAYLIGSSPGLASADDREQRKIQDENWIRLLEAPDSIDKFCDAWETQPLIAPQTALPDPLRSELSIRRRQNSAVGLAQSLASCGTGSLPSLWHRLAQISSANLIHGSEDDKFAGIAGRMKEANSSFSIHSIAGCGHAPHLEDPEAVMRVLGF